MNENESIIQKNSEGNSENIFDLIPDNEYESEEESKTPENSINLNNDNYNKDSIEK